MLPIEPEDRPLTIFKAPPQREGSPPIVDLAGITVGFPHGGSAFYSLWKPSAEELAALSAGHPVMIGILNNGQPIMPFEVSVAKSKTTILDYTPQG